MHNLDEEYCRKENVGSKLPLTEYQLQDFYQVFPLWWYIDFAEEVNHVNSFFPAISHSNLSMAAVSVEVFQTCRSLSEGRRSSEKQCTVSFFTMLSK